MRARAGFEERNVSEDTRQFAFLFAFRFLLQLGSLEQEEIPAVDRIVHEFEIPAGVIIKRFMEI